MKSFFAARVSSIPCLLGTALTVCAQTAGSATPPPATGGTNWPLGLLAAFTLLLGIGTFLFMYWLQLGKAEAFRPYFGDGQLVQLLVILIVANNVLFLALMGVLGSSEVSAIYGGIVGYVLGRRAYPQANNHQPPPSAVPDLPGTH